MILSVITTVPLYLYHMPAALLLGPMLAGIILGVKGFNLSIPKSAFNFSQGLLGCLTAEMITSDVIADLLTHWQLALIITVSTILISVLLGLFIMRFTSLPGSTAIWGIMPGGASAMVVICSDFGADMRLVALMQYLRVIMVIIMLVIMSHFLTNVETSTEIIQHVIWFPIPSINLFFTICVVIIGLFTAKILRFPSGKMLVPMMIGATLQIQGIIQLETPLWLLAFCFITIGLSVGLRFNFAVIKLAIKTLPIIILSILTMFIFCFGQAIILHFYWSVDYLTSILATSPGGLDTSVIIALDTHSDFAIILPLQILRLFSVLIFGPIIAIYFSKKLTKAK